MIESNSDHAQFKPAVNRTVICFGEWKQHPISADLDSYMNGYADPRRAGMDGLVLRFSGSVTAAAAALATGCKSDDYDDGTSPVANTAYIVEAATTPDAPVTFKRTVETLDREFVVRLVAPVDTPTRVELIVDAEAAAEYNRRHGTSYPVLDAAPGSLTLTVPKGRSGSDPLAIEVLYDETLLNGRYGMMLQPWMLPLCVDRIEGAVAPLVTDQMLGTGIRPSDIGNYATKEPVELGMADAKKDSPFYGIAFADCRMINPQLVLNAWYSIFEYYKEDPQRKLGIKVCVSVETAPKSRAGLCNLAEETRRSEGLVAGPCNGLVRNRSGPQPQRLRTAFR